MIFWLYVPDLKKIPVLIPEFFLFVEYYVMASFLPISKLDTRYVLNYCSAIKFKKENEM
jgi:hypothetical protein